jgi:hypothetical protein
MPLNAHGILGLQAGEDVNYSKQAIRLIPSADQILALLREP